MSGSSLSPITPPQFTTVPLTPDELVMCRRFMGYPAVGDQATNMESWRFFQQYGFNEYRFQHMSAQELAQVRSYLTNCISLEQAIFGAGDNLDTDQAAVWKHNRNEVGDRIGLYNYWRNQMCAFFGIPPGPGLRSCAAIVI